MSFRIFAYRSRACQSLAQLSNICLKAPHVLPEALMSVHIVDNKAKNWGGH